MTATEKQELRKIFSDHAKTICAIIRTDSEEPMAEVASGKLAERRSGI